jgi:hypothetical protein
VADEPVDNQFEQVLSRLDALMKRGQATEPAIPPAPETTLMPPGTQADVAAESAPAQQDDSTPFVIIEEAADIPVLTEIYEGTVATDPSGSGEELADAVIDALMPLMLENLDLIVAEEAAKMQENIAERLRIEIAEALRQRLQEKP